MNTTLVLIIGIESIQLVPIKYSLEFLDVKKKKN